MLSCWALLAVALACQAVGAPRSTSSGRRLAAAAAPPRLSQHEALLALKRALDPKGRLLTWQRGDPLVCGWQGVQCDATDMVSSGRGRPPRCPHPSSAPPNRNLSPGTPCWLRGGGRHEAGHARPAASAQPPAPAQP